ncbi:glycosyltransferase [Epilithonimonas caeni]|uniref:glycosyltransferase n=1 Tax=Epilithonimonas caeni TaxID=365343 RepID=UPI000409A064|nr:glycosyltransferase [Epilithonimonas caeni]
MSETTKKYKIVHFVEAFGGGVYTYVKDLCNFLALAETPLPLEIHLLYSPNRVEFDQQLFNQEIHSSVILHKLDMQREINLWNDFNIIKLTRRKLKEIKPDVLHLHSSKSGVLARMASLGLINKNKIFYSPHGYAFIQKNISKSKTCLFKIIEYSMPFLLGGITIASGNTEYEIAKKLSKSILIRNGVDFELPQKIINNIDKERLTIGTIGRLTPQKNPKFFNEIAKRIPDVDFIWIGNGELEHEIDSDNITVTGWIKTREDLLKKLNEIDAYLQVSLWEGLPIALIEAMVMRKPLIVSNIIGNKDCVENGYNGYVFDSVEEAIEKINIFRDKCQIFEFGNNSFEKASREYNKEKNFGELLKIYLL